MTDSNFGVATVDGLLATYDIVTDLLMKDRDDAYLFDLGVHLAVTRDMGGTLNLIDAAREVADTLMCNTGERVGMDDPILTPEEERHYMAMASSLWHVADTLESGEHD